MVSKAHGEDSWTKVQSWRGYYSISEDAAHIIVDHCHNIKSYYGASGVSNSMWLGGCLSLIETPFTKVMMVVKGLTHFARKVLRYAW